MQEKKCPSKLIVQLPSLNTFSFTRMYTPRRTPTRRVLLAYRIPCNRESVTGVTLRLPTEVRGTPHPNELPQVSRKDAAQKC